MIKKSLSVGVFVWLIASTTKAEIFDVKNIPDYEKFSLRFIYKGIELSSPPQKPFVMRYIAAESSVDAVYITKMVGEGTGRHPEVEIKGKAFNGYRISHLYRYRPGNKLILDTYEKNIFSPAGKKIRSEYYDFSESSPPLPKNLTHPYTLPLALRGMDFTIGREETFYVWFNPTMVFAVNLKLKCEEEITVPAGKFKCYRLEIGPDLVDFVGPVVGRALKPFIASYIAWLDAKPPHRIVRYQGPFGMVNIAGPSEIYELVKVGE